MSDPNDDRESSFLRVTAGIALLRPEATRQNCKNEIIHDCLTDESETLSDPEQTWYQRGNPSDTCRLDHIGNPAALTSPALFNRLGPRDDMDMD